MAKDLFHDELDELYKGEILGEAFFEELLPNFDGVEHRYKLSTALQLETETKARLRPYVMRMGILLNDNGEARKAGIEMAGAFDGLGWEATLVKLREILGPAVDRYKEILKAAPANYRELASSMLIHEESLLTFIDLELAGNSTNSLDAISEQLEHKLPAPE